MLISIVIPIYNVEAYLRECLNSVMAQTYDKWECIMVDDASTDGSRAIAEEFCRRDSRFRLICRDVNGGPSVARNMALDVISGDLVSFIDADDYVSDDFLTLASREIGDADIICFGFNGKSGHSGDYSGREALKKTLYQTVAELNPSFWGKVFTRKVIEDRRFTCGRIYEDLELFVKILPNVKKVMVLDKPVYFYRRHNDSTINTWSPKRLDVLTVTEEIEERYAGDSDLVRAARARRFAANFNILLLLRKNGAGDSPEADACRRELRRLRRGVLTDSRARIKDRIGALVAYMI